MPTYYRTLISVDHLIRWRTKQFNSFHHQPPSDWYRVWRRAHSTKAEDYPLICSDGVYTEQARATFLSYIPEHESQVWPGEILKCSGELLGVCAFESPSEALKYGRESVFGVLNRDRYVEFDGEYLCRAPEDKGVVARVISVSDTIYNSVQFVERHNLDLNEFSKQFNK
jgi:hypothetical protein